MSCSDDAEYRAHGASICATCDAWLGSPGIEGQRIGAIAKGQCGCDESLALAKRLDMALEALDAIRAALTKAEPSWDGERRVRWIASLVALAGSSLERGKP